MRTAEHATGLVIRAVDFSETSKVVTLFTREFGKVAALAKGARRARGAFEGSLDVLSVCRVGLLRKSTAELDLLTEARLEERFAGLGRDLPALYAGFFAAEVLDALTQPHDPHPGLFDAARACCRRLDAGAVPWGTAATLALRSLADIGYGLALDRCCGCGGAPRGDDAAPAYSADLGGLLCDACRRGQFGWTALRPDAPAALRRLAADDADDAAAWPAELRRDCWRAAVARIQALTGRASRTARFVAV